MRATNRDSNRSQCDIARARELATGRRRWSYADGCWSRTLIQKAQEASGLPGRLLSELADRLRLRFAGLMRDACGMGVLSGAQTSLVHRTQGSEQGKGGSRRPPACLVCGAVASY